MKDRIKCVRTHLNLTQTEFADELGLTKNYISLIENGQRTMGDQSLKVLCAKHRVNEEWLRTGTGSMFCEISEREKLASWISEINVLPESSVQRRVIKMLSTLEPNDWIFLEKMINSLTV